MIFKTPYYIQKLLVLLALLFTCEWSNTLQAQCAVPPAIGTCSGGNGAATNGVNINSGQTFWYSATGTFPSGVNLGGGTLRVCGNLTLSSLNFNSGSILIEAGGSLTINGGTIGMNGSSIISNRGTLTINSGITMQNLNNTIFNATPTAVLIMNSGTQALTINSSSSKLINNGIASIHTLLVQGSTSGDLVCLGSASCLNLTNITNNVTNSYYAPLGLGIVRYTGNALLNNNLTGSSNVVVCRATGSTTSGGANFGSATVINNCTSCGSALQFLPIELVIFDGIQDQENIHLNWSTTTQINNEYFTIQKSVDKTTWKEIGNIPGAGNTTLTIHYTFTDIHPNEGLQFYRLKQTNSGGTISVSSPIAVKFEGSSTDVFIYPNPNPSNHLNIHGYRQDMGYIFELKNMAGQLLYSTPLIKNSIVLPVFAGGLYLVTLRSTGTQENKTFKYILN